MTVCCEESVNVREQEPTGACDGYVGEPVGTKIDFRLFMIMVLLTADNYLFHSALR